MEKNRVFRDRDHIAGRGGAGVYSPGGTSRIGRKCARRRVVFGARFRAHLCLVGPMTHLSSDASSDMADVGIFLENEIRQIHMKYCYGEKEKKHFTRASNTTAALARPIPCDDVAVRKRNVRRRKKTATKVHIYRTGTGEISRTISGFCTTSQRD